MTDLPSDLPPGLRLVRAPNPSPMTERGTNTWLLGAGTGAGTGGGAVTVIDPGPDDPRHLAAILGALGPGDHVALIVVTHAHRDHTALAPRLAAATGAPVAARGDAWAGRSAVMTALADQGLSGGGEGLDPDFRPDLCLADGALIGTGPTELRVMHTPGHAASHICLGWGTDVFTGDTLMGWASTLVSPPDGDLSDFRNSLARLAAGGYRRGFPGHGAPIDDLPARLHWQLNHRATREAQIRAALPPAPGADLTTLTAAVYADLSPDLRPAAARNLFAHLVDLTGRGLARAHPALSPQARFHRP